MAVVDDTIVIFECKQSLHPTSMYELRTTFNYVRKAESQLDGIISAFEGGTLIPQLEAKTKLSLQHVKAVLPGIVLGNRMMCGNSFRYPVRNVHEISNVIENGTFGTKDGHFRIWQTERFTKQDLLDYLSGKNQVLDALNDALFKDTIKYVFDDYEITRNTYAIDVVKANEKIKTLTDTLVKVGDRS